ncbi:hypothetical protein CBR_g55210 [Chara braunii]|uniref:Nucleoporin Nup120/160 beta-propeller domain-containing protein n=1 Tax=Chara braunii TaxID=69332 RepID=A0A388MCY4_CHABU|nr:hypothetical protein CBR_g55210 [Chara braunii]|eukprot:GBG92329.1 hypothetical protein CBR_g55210 [Chara braunii]
MGVPTELRRSIGGCSFCDPVEVATFSWFHFPRIPEGQSKTLELWEFSLEEPSQQMSLLLRFPEPLIPFVGDAGYQVHRKDRGMLYVLTEAGIVFRIKVPVPCRALDGRISLGLGKMRQEDIQEYDLFSDIVKLDGVAATAGSGNLLVMGGQNGSVLCFQFGTQQQARALEVVFELKEGEGGIRRLWAGVLNRGRTISPPRDIFVRHFRGSVFVFVFHEDGMVRIWDVHRRTRVHCQTLSLPDVADCIPLRLFFGEVDEGSSELLLTVVYRDISQTDGDTGALPRRSARIAVRARPAVPPRPKKLSRRTTPAASSMTLTVQDATGDHPAYPVRGANEPAADYRGRLLAFTEAVAAVEARKETAEAERQRLANEAAAEAQRTTETDAETRDRRNASSTESLIACEHQWTTILQGMIFEPTEAQADPTPAEAERSNLANLLLGMMRGIMWNNTLLHSHLRTDATQRQTYKNDMTATFNGPDSISSTVAAIKTDITKLQTRPDAATKTFKMPHFDISKFDDYNKSDALSWWQRFLTEASCRMVPVDDMLKAVYLQLIGGAQGWMNHLAATHKCTIAELHTHITWKEFEQLWFTRFMVRNVVKMAINEVYTCSQGNMPTRDWASKWQKIVTTPGFDLTFPNQRSEFFSRSCAGLRSALGNEYDYTTFQAILDRTNLVIQTDDKAANER